MASVYRRRDRQGKLYPCWWYRFKDECGRIQRRPGWVEKQKTLDHARDVESECRAIRNNEKAPAASWLKVRARPLSEVVDAYLAFGRMSGGRNGRPWSPKNADLKEAALAWWLKELGLLTLADLAGLDLGRVDKLKQGLLAGGLTSKTVALRVEALRCLCSWGVKRGLLGDNPLKGLGGMDTTPENPHRPLTDDELARLFAKASPEHCLWYEVALQTGYRVDELRHLTGASLDRFGPALCLDAAFTKNRQPARQPITRELAAKLVALAAGKPPEASLLGIPTSKAWKLFKDDCGRATIQAETPAGRATWHSLRKSFVTALIRSGADLKTVQELARHSTAALSLEVYSATTPGRKLAAVEAVQKHLDEAISTSAEHTQRTQAAAVAGGESVTLDGGESSSGQGESEPVGSNPVAPTNFH